MVPGVDPVLQTGRDPMRSYSNKPDISRRARHFPTALEPRHTLARTVRREGIGLHSGRICRADVRPAPGDHGLRIHGVPATVDRVRESRFATTLESPKGPVSTVEHLLAALYGMGIDDAEIEVRGGEVPILDGSSLPWCQAIEPAITGGTRRCWQLDGPIAARADGGWIEATPADRLALDVTCEFGGIGRQHIVVEPSDDSLGLLGPIAAARTFGFRREEGGLRARGLIRGVGLSCCVVFDDGGHPVNPDGLRFADEPVRHKALDLIGDLALLGAPVAAHICAERAGHDLHHRLVRAIRARGRLEPFPVS